MDQLLKKLCAMNQTLCWQQMSNCEIANISKDEAKKMEIHKINGAANKIVLKK